MIYYFLPNPGIYGGIKVGFEFSKILQSLGKSIVMVTPNSVAPKWFSTDMPIIAREFILNRLTSDDVVFFSLPHDYSDLKASSAKLIFHCQGTDPMINPIVKDGEVTHLSCWRQAFEYMSGLGASPIDVGISISRDFFYRGELKVPKSVIYLDRKEIGVDNFTSKELSIDPVQNISQFELSKKLRHSEGFLAMIENEWFGLPALEAMAAGCLVVSPPTIGGTEYLINNRNCLVVDKSNLIAAITELIKARTQLKERFVRNAIVTSFKYHPSRQIEKITRALRETELGELI